MRPDLLDLPNIDAGAFAVPDAAALRPTAVTHCPRILLLYGSLRERSFSRFATMEAARLLESFGVPRPGYSIHPVCRFPTIRRRNTQRCRSYARCRPGRKARYGAALSVTAR
jgi:hypothetical protein